MSLYLPVRANASKVSIAICPRCNFKYQYTDMRQDPNNKLWVCKDCCDIYDPWRLPARRAEDISLTHPRPDEDIST